MSVSALEVKQLLASPELAAVEEAIAARAGQRVHRDSVDVTYTYTQIELGFTPLTADEVSRRLREERDGLVEFGVAFLADPEATESTDEFPPGEEPGPGDEGETIAELGLGCGFGITYLIYLYFLRERPRPEFTTYLKKRRIPFAAKFARDPRRVYEGMGKA